jgi:SAM-dependent methyltransferase
LRAERSGERIQWRQADAQNLLFPDQTFDAAVCQFEVMFFPDKPRAHREVFRVLKPAAGFLFSVWDRIETNDLSFIVHKTVTKIYPDDPPMFIERMPTGYQDIGKVRADLAGAGLMEPTVDTRKMPCHTPSARHPALGLIKGSPLGAEIAARDPSGLDTAVEAASRAITGRLRSWPGRSQHAGAYLHRTRPQR